MVKLGVFDVSQRIGSKKIVFIKLPVHSQLESPELGPPIQAESYQKVIRYDAYQTILSHTDDCI